MKSSRVIDYNGKGNWSVESVKSTYQRLKSSLGGVNGFVLETRTYTNSGGVTWVYNIMDSVTEGVKLGDAACIELAIAYICDNEMAMYTGYIRARMARALKWVVLADGQKQRLAATFLSQLEAGMIHQEFSDYCKLFRVIGIAPYRNRLRQLRRSDKAFIRRAVAKLLA